MNDVFGDKAISLSMPKVLAENSFDSVLVTDASKAAKIIYANRAFTKLTGDNPADVMGKTPRIPQGPDTDPKVIARLGAALKANKKFEGNAINYKQDGTPFLMFWRVLPVKVGRDTKAWVAIQREGASL